MRMPTNDQIGSSFDDFLDSEGIRDETHRIARARVRDWSMTEEDDMTAHEEPLSGGNVSDSVVRVGETVRKPATAATPGIDAFLSHLNAAGFDGAPKAMGVDGQGRHVVEFIPGKLAHDLPPMTLPEVGRIGRLIRELHAASASFVPPPGAVWDVAILPDREELICHHDIAPWNLIRDGDRWVFIDWDGSGPGSRLWDLAYAAHGFIPLGAGGDPDDDAVRLRALVDGYGLNPEQRHALPQLIVDHTRAMFDLLEDGARTGRQPWARLHAEGHADHWGPAAEYVERNLLIFSGAIKAH